MGTFTASLRAIGDSNAVPATVQLDDGNLTIAAGSTEIGTWPLSEIELEPTPTGYRMAAEGDHILIELKELDAFNEALAKGRFKRRLALRTKAKGNAADDVETATTAVATKNVAEDRRKRKPEPKTETARPSRSPKKSAGIAPSGLELLDRGIARMKKRFGPYLPDWMFSRAMALILLAVLVVMLIFPGFFSTLLLILGGATIAFGAVMYSDGMLASRWLPGRMQPPHVLIIGVAVLVLGVLVGVIAG